MLSNYIFICLIFGSVYTVIFKSINNDFGDKGIYDVTLNWTQQQELYYTIGNGSRPVGALLFFFPSNRNEFTMKVFLLKPEANYEILIFTTKNNIDEHRGLMEQLLGELNAH